MSKVSSNLAHVQAKLAQLRDSPAGTSDADDSVLALVFQFLIPDENAKATNVHWFCPRAEQTIVEAATFLLRLHAYNSARVKVWTRYLRSCLATCPECVRGLQEAKVSSRHTFFGAFSDPILEGFYTSFSNWELKIVLEALAEVQIVPSTSQNPPPSLSKAPPAIFYHLLSNLHVTQDPRILDILHHSVPAEHVTGWPTDAPPVGLLLLSMVQDKGVRGWAQRQLAMIKNTPMSPDRFLPAYASVLESATRAVSTSVSESSGGEGNNGPCSSFPFAQEHKLLWKGYCTALRHVPKAWLLPSALIAVDIRQTVMSHLSDAGPHFVDVLKSFFLVLSRIGPDLWKGESEEYPLVVFNTIKDNSRYAEMLLSGTEGWALDGLPSYLKSVGELPVFREVLPAMIQFLCEELQHDRFKEVRSNAVQVASKIFIAVLPESHRSDNTLGEYDIPWESLDIHTGIFVAVAFSKSLVGEQWREARDSARKLVKYALLWDIKNICSAVSQLTNPLKQTTPQIVPTIRQQMWKNVYDIIHPSDIEGIGIIFSILSQISHMDFLSNSAFSDIIKKSKSSDVALKAFTSINSALQTFRSGFAEAVSRVLDFSSSGSALRLLQQPDFAKYAMMLMFSPVEDIHQPAQELIGSALDVDSRLDCLRALLVTCPISSFNGMFQFLETFTKYTSVVPEACSLSKSLALCLTDIIDAMCSRPDGLLLTKSFLLSIGNGGPAVELPKWWTLMTKAISNIFSRTPRWAVYFDSKIMIMWMRDALIFGRDLLAQWKVIEDAALTDSSGSTSSRRRNRLSHVGKKMMDDLQPVLFELTRWLRLTDEELLHQSFALLQTLLACFQETQVMPSETALQKMQKHINDARKKDPNRPQTRLDSTRLERLQDTLSAFTDDDDEVQIIEPPISGSKHTRQSKLDSFVKSEPSNRKSTSTQLPIKSSRQETQPPQRSFAKSSVSSRFTSEDQRKLDSPASFPKFTRTAQSHASSSKHVSSTLVKSATSSGAPTPVTESSSESEQSDADGEGTLAELAKLQQRTPTIKKPTERRQVKMLDLPAQRMNPNFDRMNRRDDARRKVLRLKPDISSLHRNLLSWDYNHDGPEPPGSKLQFLHVPDRFSDSEHYRRVFEPLLFMECWAQIQQSKDEVQDTFQCRIDNRQYTSDWIDLDISITEGVKKDWVLMDTDIVLVQQLDGSRKFLGKSQSFKANPFNSSIQATIRLMVRSNEPGPQMGTTWKVGKVFSLTTLHREYAALMALPYYDFCDIILQPVLPKWQSVDNGEVKSTMSNFNLNEPQAKAILSALQTEGFSLIQGPPGTGKTSTICALVQIFLARRPRPATAIYAGRSSGPTDKEPPKKVLLCAPSNAAIDEITFRLKEGVSGAGQKATLPKVVRVGAPKSMNVSVKDVSLDSLVEQKINSNSDLKNTSKDQGSEIGVLRSELESVKKQRQQKFDELNSLHDNIARRTALEDEIKRLNKQKITLTHQLDKARDKQKSDFRTLDAISRRCRLEVLQEADVICTTLAGSGHELLEMFDFEMVIIDEAAQAIELSSLIPLKYRCSRVVMVGDPQQLPPTVISQEASKFSYNQSLFVRLQKQRPDAVHLLSIQYRMHPDISQLPSRLFYHGRLMDGPGMAQKTQRPWHVHPKFGTYHFYNVHRGQEAQGNSKSLINRAECQVAVSLYNRLLHEFSSFDFDFKVGVVTMYRAQVGELRRAFEKKFGAKIQATVDFNTVDGFQGQEKDVIILSCVRAGPGLQKVGFLADVRRMNVALTRAKSSVFVLGHAATLERSDETWRMIVQDARARSCLVDTDVTFFTSAAKQPEPAPSVPNVGKPPPANISQPNLPQGLSTPQALAALSRRVSAPKQPPSPAKNNDIQENNIPPVLSLKRPAPDEEPVRLPPGPQNSNEPQKPKGKPLAKRPKQTPNLFIPQKRKPPDPGSSKRRT